MQITFAEFGRIKRALEWMSGPPSDVEQARPELANVLFCARLGQPGTWAFYTQGFEIMGVRVRTLTPLVGRLIYPRGEVGTAYRTLFQAQAREDDIVELAEGRIVLRRVLADPNLGDVELPVTDGLFPGLRNLPEPVGPAQTLPPETLGRLQRAAEGWGGSGGTLWLHAEEGVFSHAQGVIRRSPGPLPLVEPKLGFSDFLGVMGLDPKIPCACSLAALPGLESRGLPWVALVQPDAVHFSLRLTAEELADAHLEAKEETLRQIMAAERPWLRVSPRTGRRAMIRLLAGIAGPGILLSGDELGVAQATNGIAPPVILPMAQVMGPGKIACRTEDVNRVLRQDFGVLGLTAPGTVPGISFRRSEGTEHGALTDVVRP